MLRQCYFARLDMELHTLPADKASTVDPFALQADIAKTHTVLAPLPEDRFLCSFMHIFAGGYAAGYYSYKVASRRAACAWVVCC